MTKPNEGYPKLKSFIPAIFTAKFMKMFGAMHNSPLQQILDEDLRQNAARIAAKILGHWPSDTELLAGMKIGKLVLAAEAEERRMVYFNDKLIMIERAFYLQDPPTVLLQEAPTGEISGEHGTVTTDDGA